MPESAKIMTCPICRKPADAAFKPFCGKRCADVDLHRWLSGVYAVPVQDNDEDEKPSLAPSDEPEA
jgi:hypothetical protein